jgi:hypothetical protein
LKRSSASRHERQSNLAFMATVSKASAALRPSSMETVCVDEARACCGKDRTARVRFMKCQSVGGMWCRGTESNCRHQPFQGVRERSDFNELRGFQNAISDIRCHAISIDYRMRCHNWHSIFMADPASYERRLWVEPREREWVAFYGNGLPFN